MKSNNFQAIYVMWIRELKRFVRAKSRLIGSIATPFFFLLFMGVGFDSGLNLSTASAETSYFNFLVPGIMGMTMLFSSMFAGISVLWDKEFGFLKEIMVAPVKRFAIVLGRIAGGLTTAFIQGVLILGVSFLMGFRITNLSGIILAFIFMILIGVGFIGFGLAIASVMEDIHGFSLISNLITFPLFLLSGAFFPVKNFPNWLRPLSYLDPLTYGVDGLRFSLINFSQFSLILDLAILLIFDLLMVFLGSFLFNRTEVG